MNYSMWPKGHNIAECTNFGLIALDMQLIALYPNKQISLMQE